MKKYIRLITLTALFIFSCIFNTSAQTGIVDSMDFQNADKAVIQLSLTDAIKVALKDNYNIRKANLDMDAARATRESTLLTRDKASMSPRANFDGSYEALIVKQLDMSADYVIEKAKRNITAATTALTADIEQTYYQVLQAQQTVDINKAYLDLTKDLYNKVKRKYDLGLVAKQEVISNELNVTNAENAYSASLSTLKALKMTLNSKLGYNIMADVKLKDQLTYKEFKAPGIGKAVSDALANRNEMYAAKYANDMSSLDTELTLRQYPETTIMYKTKKAASDKAFEDYSNALKSIEIDVRINYLDIEQKYNLIKSSEKSVELSTEVLKIRQVQYDTGMGLLTDVQKAQADLQQAKLGLSKAKLDYNLSVSKFKDCIGQGRSSITMP